MRESYQISLLYNGALFVSKLGIISLFLVSDQ